MVNINTLAVPPLVENQTQNEISKSTNFSPKNDPIDEVSEILKGGL